MVDDGSVDDSLDVLGRFGSRITVIAQENAGPRVACNRGFARSSGDVVIFLDSDDVLEPSIAREVATVWSPDVSKVQVQMSRIDAAGRPVGRPFPTFATAPTPDQVRRWMTATSAYPTPPGSGNAYARSFLDQLFPLDGRCGDATDSACLAAAPYLGDVLTVPRPLVRYRVHGDNRSSLRADPTRLTRQIERARQRECFARSVSGRADDSDPARALVPLRRGRHLLQMRVAERRLRRTGRPAIPTDTFRQLLGDSVAGFFAPGPESTLHRLVVSVWCVATLVAPPRMARRLVRWRFG